MINILTTDENGVEALSAAEGFLSDLADELNWTILNETDVDDQTGDRGRAPGPAGVVDARRDSRPALQRTAGVRVRRGGGVVTDLLNGPVRFGSGIPITVWIVWLWLWPQRCPDRYMHVGGLRQLEPPVDAHDAARHDLAACADYLAREDVVLSLSPRREHPRR